MSRFSFVLAVAMVLSLVGTAQAQVSTTLSPQDSILRLQEGENWIFALDANGNPQVGDNHQWQNGAPLVEMNPSTQRYYEENQVQEVFASYSSMLPISYSYASTSITMQTRVITFPDAAHAEGYLNVVFESQLETVALGEIEDRQFELIETTPDFEFPLVGWTSVTSFVDSSTGASSGFASSVRYHAQIDNVIVSAEASGPFVDFNFDIAFWLLQGQAFCVQQETACAPSTLPMGDADWFFIGDVLHFAGNTTTDGAEARWIFPVEAPVRMPEVSATLSP